MVIFACGGPTVVYYSFTSLYVRYAVLNSIIRVSETELGLVSREGGGSVTDTSAYFVP